SAISYTVSSITGGQRYFYRVAALDGSGLRSVNSPVVSIVNRPDAPTNFSVTSLSTNQLVVNWRDTSGETGYRVERSTDGGANWSILASVGQNIPSYLDSSLTA